MPNMTRLLNDALAQAQTSSPDEHGRIASLVFAQLEGPYEPGADR